MATDRNDSAALDFDLIAYRGSPVATFDGWRADVKSRGGGVTQVPGGFFVGVKAARFGSSKPYVYELPPVWLLVWDGVDVATYEFLEWADYQGISAAAENQRQDVENIGRGVARVVTGAGKIAGDVGAGLPTALKWGAIGLAAVLGLQLVKTLAPRRNPPRRRRRSSG